MDAMMTHKKEFTERRKDERFRIKNGAVSMIRPLNSDAATHKYCQIINISKDGLAFRYINKNGELNEPFELDLLFIQDICFTYLKNVPFKTVWIFHEPSKTSFSKLKIIKQGVQFGKMMPNQISRLDRFLLKVTYHHQMQVNEKLKDAKKTIYQ
jgi:hypothetical protein